MKWSSLSKVKSKKELYNLTKQFLMFGLVGVSNTALSLTIYYAFVFINPELYIVGNAIGFLVSVLNAYYWNNKYVFRKSEQGHIKTILKTYMAYGGTFIFGVILLFLLVELVGMSHYLAPILILAFTIPLNFVVNRFWTFK